MLRALELIDAACSRPAADRLRFIRMLIFREYSMPLLTSMRSPAFEIGEEAAAALMKRITKGSFQPDRVLEVQFLPGQTCERLRPAFNNRGLCAAWRWVSNPSRKPFRTQRLVECPTLLAR